MTLMIAAPCGRFQRSAPTHCEACGRRIRCVYATESRHDAGWIFLLGRRCYQRLQAWLDEGGTT